MAGKRSETGDSIVESVVFFSILGVIGLGIYWAWTEWRGAGWWFWRDCAFGSELAGAHPPTGVEEWCQVETSDGDIVKDGRYRRWNPQGLLIVVGHFNRGTPSSGWLKRNGMIFVPVPDVASVYPAPAADASLPPPEDMRRHGEALPKVVIRITTESKEVLAVEKEEDCFSAVEGQCEYQPTIWCGASAAVQEKCWADLPSCKAGGATDCVETSVQKRWASQRIRRLLNE